MAYEFKLPDLGEGIHEGIIKKWHVKEGDTVKADQVIAELETDKAVVEMPSPKAGVMLKLFGKEGEVTHVGKVFMVIGQPGETYQGSGSPATHVPIQPIPASSIAVQAPKPVPAVMPAQPLVQIQPIHESVKVEQKTIVEQIKPIPAVTTKPGNVQATPFVRKIARELGVDLEMIIGSGENGRITEQDVKKAAGSSSSQTTIQSQVTPSNEQALMQQPTTPQLAPKVQIPLSESSFLSSIAQSAPVDPQIPKQMSVTVDGEVERIPFKGIRKIISDHMITSARTAVHVTHMEEADVTELVNIRERGKVLAAQKGIKLTYLSFILKALVSALKNFPDFNASIDDQKAEIVFKKYYNIGVAVDTPEGLLVPVIKNANRKTVMEVAKEIGDLAEKARARKLTLDEMKGGTFTITNIGSVGGVFATPIINYPEVAILGVYKMEDRPVVRKGEVRVRKMLNFTVTFDHRLIDGAQAARFANMIKSHLEDPGLMLVD